MIGFPKTPPLRRVALALGLLVAATSAADAAPLRYNITDLGWVSGTGLDNDGEVIAQPVRNITRPNQFEYEGNYVVDGTDDGLVLMTSYGQYSQSQIPTARVFDPEYLKYDTQGYGVYTLAGNVGLRWTRGADMNERGEIVGSGNWGNVDATRFFYAAPGSIVLQDLADLIPPNSGWDITDVYSINDVGQILGRGVNPDGEPTNFLMTPEDIPVPEPGTWAIFGLAAAALAWRNRRRAG